MKIKNAFVAAIALAGLVLAQESRPTSDQIRAQLKQLDNDSFEVRTKAMEGLRAMGEDARAELEAAKKSDSLEVRTRAESLLKELDGRKSGKKADLKPVSPDDEAHAGQQKAREGQPRPQDFGDQRAYVEALRKWFAEQMDKDSRFPKFVLPDEKDWANAFSKDFVIVEPQEIGAGSMVITRQSNGETMSYKSGTDGVKLEVKRKNEAGETVVESWEAKDANEFKTKYPDVWEKYKPTEGSGRSWSVLSPGATGLWRTAPEKPLELPGRLVPLGPVAGSGPRFGVITTPVPPVLDKQLKLKGEGIVIESVSENSIASRMGITEHDVLLQINGQVIHDRDDVLRLMVKKDLPATMTAKIVREGAVMELSAPRETGR